jgi:hypothetical protein
MCDARNKSVLIAASFACLSLLSLLVGSCLKGATQAPAKHSSVARQNASQTELVFNLQAQTSKTKLDHRLLCLWWEDIPMKGQTLVRIFSAAMSLLASKEGLM